RGAVDARLLHRARHQLAGGADKRPPCGGLLEAPIPAHAYEPHLVEIERELLRFRQGHLLRGEPHELRAAQRACTQGRAVVAGCSAPCATYCGATPFAHDVNHGASQSTTRASTVGLPSSSSTTFFSSSRL